MKKLQFTIVRLLVLAALFATGAYGNVVPLDTTFNGTGFSIQAAAPNPERSYGTSFAIQPDGKIVVGGHTHINGDNDKFAVMRLNADGTLDTGFGTGGSTTTQVGTDVFAGKVLLQSDGKILLLGQSWGGDATTYNITILRYTSGGALDTSFNSTGFRTQNISGASYDGGADMLLLPDGKLLVVGNTNATPSEQGDIVLMRINTDGSLDTTFDGDGILIVANPEGESAYSAILLADGKILTGGSRSEGGGNSKFLLMRFNSNGSLDTSFGTGGSTTTAGTGAVNITTMDLQSDGKIVVGGSGFLARYTTGGTLDTTFGAGGIIHVPTFTEMNHIKVAPDDKILIASKFGANAGVTRVLSNGYSDTNFNGGARNIFTPGGSSCIADEIKFQSDGKIVLGGYCSPNGIPKFAVWRLQETRTKRLLDFDGNESTEFSLFRPSTGEWFLTAATSFQTSTTTAQWGASTDKPIPADYTGDGRTDIAVFRPSTGEWFVLRSENGTFYSFPFGTSTDVPVPADYDGDDIADAGVFRPSTGEWFLQKSTSGLFITTFGTTGDKPVPSDFDGDFKTDIAIYRPSAGEWWIQKSSDSTVYAFPFGTSTDKPVQGDYTGDNKTDAAFWRPSTGEWFILRSEDYSYYSAPFGLNGDLPAPGNYGGDGKFDFVIYRPSENTWHVRLAEGTYFYRVFGAAGDQPVPNVFVP